MRNLASSRHQAGLVWLGPVFRGVVVICAIWYAIFLVQHVAAYAGGADSSGYLNSARLFSQGRLSTVPRLLPGQTFNEFDRLTNVPLGFVIQSDGRMTPTYPTGYPLQLTVAAAIVGWDRAAILVNLVSALASGLLLFACCRKLGLNSSFALGGVALLGFCPLFLFSAFQPMSDLSAVCWCLAVLYCALRVREHWKYGLFCGIALGMAVLVRPSNLLLALPLLFAVGFHLRSWLAVGVGGLPAAAFFCFYNRRVYGSPWVTGYGDFSSVFGVANAPHNLAHFAQWIPVLLSPLIVLAVVAPFTAVVRQRGFAVLAAWAVVLVGFYAFYYHAGETWWYLRFILPAFPVLIVGALVVLEAAWRTARSRSVVAAAAAAGLLVLGVISWQHRQIRTLDVLHTKNGERIYPDAARWARENLPARSAIFCMQVSGSFFYYTDFLLIRWDQVSREKCGPLFAALARDNRPVYAVLFPFENPEALQQIGGHWTKLSTLGIVTFWQRQP